MKPYTKRCEKGDNCVGSFNYHGKPIARKSLLGKPKNGPLKRMSMNRLPSMATKMFCWTTAASIALRPYRWKGFINQADENSLA